ncbi:MAG: hypothetical protein Q7S52_06015, partial [bacterium]|nr:hypothetical protein [bacterium]
AQLFRRELCQGNALTKTNLRACKRPQKAIPRSREKGEYCLVEKGRQMASQSDISLTRYGSPRWNAANLVVSPLGSGLLRGRILQGLTPPRTAGPDLVFYELSAFFCV